jgi:hypothetical protein
VATVLRFEELLTDESSLMGGILMDDIEDLWEVGEKAYVADVVWKCGTWHSRAYYNRLYEDILDQLMYLCRGRSWSCFP